MKKILSLITVAFLACNPHPEKEGKPKAEDSTLTGFDKVNEQLEKSNSSLLQKNDSILAEFKKKNEQLEKTRDSLKLILHDLSQKQDSSLRK